MTPVSGQPKRLPHIDLLKTLAIWFVLIFHFTLYPNIVYPDMPLPLLMRYYSQTILSTCVPLFFFVSGYLMLGRPLNLKKHTIRTVKMMILTCFWILFLLILMYHSNQEPILWEELGQGIWDLQDGWSNHLWYMAGLIGIYLIYPLLKSAYDNCRIYFFWFTGVMVFLVFGSTLLNLLVILFNLFVKKEFFLFYNNLPIFNQFNPFSYDMRIGLAYFCLGGTVLILEKHLLNIPARWRNLAASLGMLILCGTYGTIGWRFSLYINTTWDVVWNGYGTVFTLGNVLCLYVLSLNLKRDVPILRWISSNTLGIYLLHSLLHRIIRPITRPIEALRSLPGTLVYASGILLVCLALCFLLKKIPLVKHLIS